VPNWARTAEFENSIFVFYLFPLLVSRTGAKPADAGTNGVALDARDGLGLARVSAGADAIFMSAMAPYTPGGRRTFRRS
jgi:hypothetical protein